MEKTKYKILSINTQILSTINKYIKFHNLICHYSLIIDQHNLYHYIIKKEHVQLVCFPSTNHHNMLVRKTSTPTTCLIKAIQNHIDNKHYRNFKLIVLVNKSLKTNNKNNQYNNSYYLKDNNHLS